MIFIGQPKIEHGKYLWRMELPQSKWRNGATRMGLTMVLYSTLPTLGMAQTFQVVYIVYIMCISVDHIRPWSLTWKIWKRRFLSETIIWGSILNFWGGNSDIDIMSITSIYLIFLSVLSIHVSTTRLANWSVNTLLLRHPYLWLWSTPTDPEPKFGHFGA